MNKKTIYSPDAAAYIKGSSKYSNLHGVVTFKTNTKGCMGQCRNIWTAV